MFRPFNSNQESIMAKKAKKKATKKKASKKKAK
jgi:hypothetical protein